MALKSPVQRLLGDTALRSVLASSSQSSRVDSPLREWSRGQQTASTSGSSEEITVEVSVSYSPERHCSSETTFAWICAQ